MASFAEQMNVHRAARVATASLEASVRSQIEQIFSSWESDELTSQTVRYRLEAVIRSAYRTSAAIAREVAQKNSELPDWLSHEVFNSEYLQDLLGDVRRNLRDYKAGILTRKSAVSRMEHSAGVAAQRGYTDQLIASYSELQDFGFELRKYWVANFVNNTPCPSCVRLHGTSVELKDSFKAEVGESGVYRDLQGPPRHPRCQCGLYILITTLENFLESPNFEQPQDSPSMISTQDVKKMTKGFFSSIVSSLSAILSFLRRH